MKHFIGKIALSFILAVVVVGDMMSGVSFADTRDVSSTAKITRFDIKHAREHIAELDKDIAKITQELKMLDRQEVDKY